VFVFSSKYIDDCGNLIFNRSFYCSKDSLMFFLISGHYCIVPKFRKTEALLLMDKLFLARR